MNTKTFFFFSKPLFVMAIGLAFICNSCQSNLFPDGGNLNDAQLKADLQQSAVLKPCVVSCMEVNDTNPLNNLCFTLKNSKQPLVNVVILFAANINYNQSQKKVYVNNNPNVQHLLDNRAKYLKPLQDKGIKVVLGILGNHDESGIADLADETARSFAQELKKVCDTYHLDGVFFDDEYSDYKYNPDPGFVTPSPRAAARLCYETKKAMPDRLMCVYVYGNTYSLPSVDGEQPGQFIDYALADYGQSGDYGRNYPGLAKSGWGFYSQQFNFGYIASSSQLQDVRDNGYANMIFAMDPTRSNFKSTQKPAMENMARILFNDELVYDGKPYRKDW